MQVIFVEGNINKRLNLVLSGGGIKGIAYIGVFEVIESMGYHAGNIAGVSAGALAGSFAAAGYKADEIKKIMHEFDFEKLSISQIPQKVPVVQRYMEYNPELLMQTRNNMRFFMSNTNYNERSNDDIEFLLDLPQYRANFLKNLVTLSKKGSLFDGDLLENWVYKVLARRGIKKFGDLRGGIKDQVNPGGYKLRMTAVDINRAKIVVLPDDISYYGIEPDKLEVAKAVRMSTAVPFAFKAVELPKTECSKTKMHYLVDGGVFDNFPMWMINYSKTVPKIGFRLYSGEEKLLSLSTPLKVLKSLINAVHDTGVPTNQVDSSFIAKIDVSKVSSLDFGLDEEEKDYLYNSGKNAAYKFFSSFDYRISNIRYLFHWLFGR